jgi:NAD(P)H-flavin reductase
MKPLSTIITEIFQLGDETCAVLNLPEKFWPQPGQYLTSQHSTGQVEILPVNLFKVYSKPGGLSVGPVPGHWQPGDRLDCMPPKGHRFQIPMSGRHVGLLAYQVPPTRLLALAEQIRSNKAAAALFCEPSPTDALLTAIPADMEVSPVSILLDNLDWPDYLAVDLQLEDLPQLTDLIQPNTLRCEGQVLIRTAMPCGGVAECGVCALKTRSGWQLACDDGPVFDLHEVLHVA